MFDRSKVFFVGQHDIFCSHVILLIDPSPFGSIDMPKWCDVDRCVLGNWNVASFGTIPEIHDSLKCRVSASFQCAMGRQIAIRCTNNRQASWHHCSGYKGCNFFVPFGATALMTGHMDVWVPTTRNPQSPTRQRACCPSWKCHFCSG